MPLPDSLQPLIPVAIAMGVLLTAGLASLLTFVLRPQAAPLPWKSQLAQAARTSPWQWADLFNILLLVAIAQVIRAFLPPSTGWDVLAFHGVLLAGIAWRARGKPDPFGIRTPACSIARQALLRWLAILPVLWFSAFLWQLFLQRIGHVPDLQDAIQLFIDTDSPLKRAGFLFIAVVVAPLAEEGLFRGILQPLLIRRLGAVAGLALTALGFAALHADMGTFVSLAVFSVALSMAAARTGTLWVPVLMHALFNAVNLILLTVLIRAGVV